MSELSLGIDIGGTFTDIVLYDPVSGAQHNYKELTTPEDPSVAVLVGVRRLCALHAIDPARIGRVTHATTLFTNALIERRGAPTALITTEGFRDVLEIGRERRYDLYDVFVEMPVPLVPRALRLEVPERINAAGVVMRELDLDALDRVADQAVAAGAQSIAVVFLHAYANPEHEQRAEQRIRARHPGLHVSASYDVAPEIREFERASTTVANAYIKPLAHAYLDSLQRELRRLGIPAPLFLMLSSGGLTHIEEAKRVPIQLLESGPAAGALVAAHFSKQAAIANVLAFDMGGTTAKLSVVDEGEPLIAYSFEAARTKRFKQGSGMPIKISTIELIEIGAGGGSIARIDEMGLIKVGPQSAGSEPGPACYGRDGKNPTVTDANLLLGYLNPDYFAGGTLCIDPALAEGAVGELGARGGLDTVAAAWGVHDIVNENMAGAARVHIAERGKDARRYALITTGGGGPLHGYAVARKLGLGRLICPRGAGVASALGLLVAPARVDRVVTVARHLDDIDWPALEAEFTRMEWAAAEVLKETGIGQRTTRIRRFADMRYVGQGFELVVPLPEGDYAQGLRQQVLDAFKIAYRDVFKRNPPTDNVEMVNARISVTAELATLPKAAGSTAASIAEARPTGSRKAYFAETGSFHDTPVLDRNRLPTGFTATGPLIVEEPESTLIVGPGGLLTVDPDGTIQVELPRAAA